MSRRTAAGVMVAQSVQVSSSGEIDDVTCTLLEIRAHSAKIIVPAGTRLPTSICLRLRPGGMNWMSEVVWQRLGVAEVEFI
ncbi:MAG: hypothetical protein K2X71_24345 [Methylobacterium sp.]|nr:hypothetical protein [Methylobacterium sp.]